MPKRTLKRTLVAVAIVAALGGGSAWTASFGHSDKVTRVERASGPGSFDHRVPASAVRVLGRAGPGQRLHLPRR